jgi:small subunit ribosomal protein S2
MEVFDLAKINVLLEEARAFLKKLGEEKKSVLWVGTKPSVRELLQSTAKKLGASYVSRRWIGGTLTNSKILGGRLKYFDDLKRRYQSGDLGKYTKKEQLQIMREIKSLEEKFSGIENLKSDLAAIVIVDPKEEKTAFHEAKKTKLPVVAILSSDNDLSGVRYPIPANDSSPSSVGYILKRLSDAYEEGARSAKPAEEVKMQ